MNERYFYWAFDPSSRALAGPETDENAINQLAFSTIDADFRVYYLPTKDRRRAAGMIKKRLLSETKSIQQSMAHFKHVHNNSEGE